MARYSERMRGRTAAVLTIILIVLTVAICFGMVPLLPLGTMRVLAWCSNSSGVDGEYIGSYRIVFVSVSGPQKAVGLTTADPRNPATFRLAPGTYIVSATYDQIFVSENVTVTWGRTVEVFLIFGGYPPPG